MLGILWIRIVFLLPLRSECASWARYLKLTTTKIIIKVFNTLKNITRYHSCLRENLSKQILSNVFVRHRRTAKKRNLTFNNIKYNSLNISKVTDCRWKNTCLKKCRLFVPRYSTYLLFRQAWPDHQLHVPWPGRDSLRLFWRPCWSQESESSLRRGSRTANTGNTSVTSSAVSLLVLRILVLTMYFYY